MDCPTWDGVLLAGAAVFAAAVAAWTANHRIDKQLTAESKRLDRQLEAESRRLDRQLAHDRWVREAEELRRMIDEAAQTGTKAGTAIHEFRQQVRHYERDGSPSVFYLPRLEEAKHAVQSLQAFVERFELRLGKRHAVPEAMISWQVELEKALEILESQPPTTEGFKEGGKRLSDSAGRYVNFMDTARPFVRLEPPDDQDGVSA